MASKYCIAWNGGCKNESCRDSQMVGVTSGRNRYRRLITNRSQSDSLCNGRLQLWSFAWNLSSLQEFMTASCYYLHTCFSNGHSFQIHCTTLLATFYRLVFRMGHSFQIHSTTLLECYKAFLANKEWIRGHVNCMHHKQIKLGYLLHIDDIEMVT